MTTFIETNCGSPFIYNVEQPKAPASILTKNSNTVPSHSKTNTT